MARPCLGWPSSKCFSKTGDGKAGSLTDLREVSQQLGRPGCRLQARAGLVHPLQALAGLGGRHGDQGRVLAARAAHAPHGVLLRACSRHTPLSRWRQHGL